MNLLDLLDLPLGVWVGAALLIFWAVGAYNRLVRLRGSAVQAFSLLESQWLRHLAWLDVQAMPKASPASPDTADWRILQPAITQFRACLQAAKIRPLDASQLAALSSAWTVMRMACDQTLAAASDADAFFSEALRPQWKQMMVQDQAAVTAFNAAVAELNAALRQFPAFVLAWLVGFRVARPL